MAKQIKFNEDARRSLKRGVDVIANAVLSAPRAATLPSTASTARPPSLTTA
jgi:hypothetical protein